MQNMDAGPGPWTTPVEDVQSLKKKREFFPRGLLNFRNFNWTILESLKIVLCNLIQNFLEFHANV